MKVATSTEYAIREFGEKEGLKMLKEAGFDCLDYTLCFEIDNLAGMIAHEPKIQEAAAYAKEQGVVFHQAHAPYPSSVDDDDEDFDNAEIFQMIVKAMEYASILGIPTLIVHPKKHLPRKGNEEALYQMNMEFCQNLLPYCEKYNVRIALENVYQRDVDRGCYVYGACAYPEEFIRYLDSLPRKWFVGCLDAGHCALGVYVLEGNSLRRVLQPLTVSAEYLCVFDRTNSSAVDILNPHVTEQFIQETYDRYYAVL